MIASAASATYANQLELNLASIETPGLIARDIRLKLANLQGGPTELTIGQLAFAGKKFASAQLVCGNFSWSKQRLDCRQGIMRLAGQKSLPLEFGYHLATQQLDLQIADADVGALQSWFPQLAGWHPAGRFDARIRLGSAQVDASLKLRQLSFASDDGKLAGEKIETSLHLQATSQDKPGKQAENQRQWAWQGEIDWPRGEAFVAPLYRAGGARLTASGRLNTDQLMVQQATLQLNDLGTLSGTLQWAFAGDKNEKHGGKLVLAEIDSSWLNLSDVMLQLLQPFLDAQAGGKISAKGKVRFAAKWNNSFGLEGLQQLDLILNEASIENSNSSLALRNINATIPWSRNGATQAAITVSSGKLGHLPLGAFSLPVSMQGLDFSLSRVEIPLLDGQLLFEDIHAAQRNGTWQWRLGGALYPISMPLLTNALGIPHMKGVISATIPGISYANEILALDGVLVISVFDGYLSANGIKIIEPFGRLPRVQANVEMRHLDLGMLTETFSFGNITGFIDGNIHKLELANWQPQSFTAMLESSPGDYRKRISQRAVQNISSLGGAGAGAAIQRSFLGFFDTFGYDRIRLSCKMENGICAMSGIEKLQQGYVIVKGGGIPSLNVIGYNRQVNWEELVSRIQAVIASNRKPVIQ